MASDIDAVYISSRNDQHVGQAVAAAEAGKHILVEKPMALGIADAETMINAARRNGVVLAVNHHLAGSPLHATARRPGPRRRDRQPALGPGEPRRDAARAPARLAAEPTHPEPG